MKNNKNSDKDKNAPLKKENGDPHRNRRIRVRDRYEAENGFHNFAPHEVLELILFGGVPYKDTNEMAHELIKKFGSLRNVFNATLPELINSGVKGMTYNAAVSIHSVNSVKNYIKIHEAEQKFNIQRFADAYNYLYSEISHLPDETMLVVCMNKQYKLIKSAIIARGIPDAVTFFMRNVIKFSLECNATSVILAHNHPSNNVNPSINDNEITEQALISLGSVSIQLVDHVIIGSEYGSFYSYANDKKLDILYNSRSELKNYFISLRECNFDNDFFNDGGKPVNNRDTRNDGGIEDAEDRCKNEYYSVYNDDADNGTFSGDDENDEAYGDYDETDNFFEK